MKKILADLNFESVKELVLSCGQPAYRAEQIFTGIYNGFSIDEINIGGELKKKLLAEYEDTPVKIAEKIEADDGSIKFLYELKDGNIIEGVLMRYKHGNTLCVSTQVGCRMGCAFCASGIGGLVRNLSRGEILSQVLVVNRLLGGTAAKREITNLVLMGSGEPLDNYDEVVGFLRLVSGKGINISCRNISLSTCGLADRIYTLAKEGLPVNLTVSLHSPFDEERKKIMPAAKAYSIEQILKACDFYFKETGRRFIFEYTLISGVNDRREDIDELVRLLKPRPCHLNLIRLNEVKENKLVSTDKKAAYRFMGELEKHGVSVSLRRQIGAGIGGACGQLRNMHINRPR